MFKRKIEEKILEKLFKGKVIVLFGPRRSGKTTLSKKILSQFNDDGFYLNCEDLQQKMLLKEGNPHDLKNFLGKRKIVILDEAQTVEHIGSFLKIFVDTYPEIQLIATGSSSFDLANRVGEPLVGRAYEFFLPPLGYAEIYGDISDVLQAKKALSDQLIFGSFPQVVTAIGDDKILNLGQLAQNYLYKDIFTFENIKKPKLVDELLRLFALQIGQIVNLNELSMQLGVSRPTVERYISLLEKTFVIKRVYSLSRNRRDEVKNVFKVYFFDLGVRNYILNRFQPLEVRNDFGFLFENYFVMEMIKKFYYESFYLPKLYFWRIYKKQFEIDFIYEKDQILKAFECKWSDKEVSFNEYLKSYPGSETKVVTKDIFFSFLLPN